MQSNLEANQWVDQYADALYSFALMRVGDPERSRDLVQETFVAALQSAQTYQAKSGRYTWLVGILKHKILDHFRAKYRKSAITVADVDSLVEEQYTDLGSWKTKPGNWRLDPEQVFEIKEFWQTLEKCLAQLPERQRQVWTQRSIDGVETDELCKVFGLSATNLWVMLHRGRARLRSCLEKNWFQSE